MNWKRTLTLAAILTAIGFAALLAVKLFISPQRIAAAIIPRMQEILDHQVSVGSSQLSFFPPGVRISNLSIENKPPFETRPLARIDHVDAYVQIVPLLMGKIKIKELVIDGWEMFLEKDSLGLVNYDFFRARSIFPGQQEQVQEPLCRRFRLNDGRLLYRDDSTGVRFVLGNVRLDYDLKGERLSDISGKLQIDSLFLWVDAGDFLIYPDAVEADWRGFYSAPHDSVAFRRCNWRIDAFAGRLDGAVANIGVRPAFNLRLLSERTELADCRNSRIIKAIPLLRDMVLAGQTRVDISYSAVAGNPASRNLRGKISLNDFVGTLPTSNLDLRGQLIESNFNEKTLSLYTESAQINGSPASMRVTIDNYQKPTISGEANIDCGADLIARFLELDPSTRVTGGVIANLSGFIKSGDPDQSRIFGSLLLNQLSVIDSARNLALDTLTVDVQFTGDRAQISRFDLAIGNNKLQATGEIADFPLLFASREESRRRPLFDGLISSDYFDFDTLNYFGSSSGTDTGSVIGTISRLADINSSARIRIAHGRLAGVDFDDLESRLSVVNRIVYSDSTTCRLFAGRATGEVVIDLNRLLQPEFELEVRAEEVLADLLLDRFTRFGPRLSGDLDLQLTAKWKGASTNDVLATLVLRGEAVVEDGRISPFDLSKQFEESIEIPAFDKGKVRDLVGSFLFGDQTFRFTTLAFGSGNLDYFVTGSASTAGSLELSITRKVSKDEVRMLQSRPDFLKGTRDKSPKSVIFDLKGTVDSPIFTVSGTR